MNKLQHYFYEVDLTWNEERSGTLRSMSFPDIEVVTPPEFFKGKKNKWTPEHLLAGAVSSCLMTTFLAIAEKGKLSVLGYKSHCLVKLENKDGKLEASEILIRPTIKLISDQDMTKALLLMEKAEKICPVKNALKFSVQVHPEFEFLNRGEKIKI